MCIIESNIIFQIYVFIEIVKFFYNESIWQSVHISVTTCYIPSQELPHVFMLDEKRFEVLSVWHYPFIYSLET
jgi:hypothetical protein